jgi:hypothetical protein
VILDEPHHRDVASHAVGTEGGVEVDRSRAVALRR